MILLSVDPGPKLSAYSVLDTHSSLSKKISKFQKLQNEELLKVLKSSRNKKLILEQIKSYGNVIGDEVLTTVLWSGRFIQAHDGEHELIPRKTVCSVLCRNSRAKDKNIRQAIIDRFGGKESAIGKKKSPGPLYGVSGDMWSAIAVGLAYEEIQNEIAKEIL